MRVRTREQEQQRRKQGQQQARERNPKRLNNVLKEAAAVKLQTMQVQATMTIFGAAGKVCIQQGWKMIKLPNKCDRTKAMHESMITSIANKLKCRIKARH